MRSPANLTTPSSTIWPPMPRLMRSANRTRPEIARSSVDLPAPFGPTTPTSSPCFTSREMPFRICALSYRTNRFSISSSDMVASTERPVRASQICLDDFRVLDDLGGRAVGGDLARVDRADAVRRRPPPLPLLLH